MKHSVLTDVCVLLVFILDLLFAENACYGPVVCTSKGLTTPQWKRVGDQEKEQDCSTVTPPKGEKGSNGEKGEKGIPGENGTIGEKGIKGEGGIKGEEGSIGANGTKGDKGPQGERGEPANNTEINTVKAELEILKKSNANMSQQLQEFSRVIEEQQSEIKDLKKTTKHHRCYLGMRRGDIPDSALNASSMHNDLFPPERARMDLPSDGHYKGAWCPLKTVSPNWYQVDLGRVLPITGFVIQKRADVNQFIRTFTVNCGDTIDSLKNVTSDGKTKIFEGNTDEFSKVTKKLPTKLNCRFIRIYPQTFEGNACLRLEIIHGSCYSEF